MAEGIKSIHEELSTIPLVDEDAQEISDDDITARPANRLPDSCRLATASKSADAATGTDDSDEAAANSMSSVDMATVNGSFSHEASIESLRAAFANGLDSYTGPECK